MLKTKPMFLEEDGKAKFVVLSMRDYSAIQAALEDAEDARILDQARRRGAGKPRIPHEQILREFGLKPGRKDDADCRAIEASKKRQAGSPRTALADVKRELEVAWTRKKH